MENTIAKWKIMRINIKTLESAVGNGNTAGAPECARPGMTEFTGVIAVGGIRE
jgi:hypothetical protein